jgi:uncharacterized protein (DUF697 family)
MRLTLRTGKIVLERSPWQIHLPHSQRKIMFNVPPDSPAAPPAAPAVETPKSSIDIIRRHVVWSMAAGLVPIPLVDLAAVTATQLKMLSALAEHYKMEFDGERGRSVIGSLLSTVTALSIGRGVLGSLIKSIPVVGTIGGLAVVPAMAGAATYALGKVFAAHFESGGTLLTFDAGSMKEEFARQLKVGEQVAHDLKDKVAAEIKGTS